MMILSLPVLLPAAVLMLLATHGSAQNIVLDLDTDDTSTLNTDIVFMEAERRVGLLENSSISIQDDQSGDTLLTRATVQFFNPSAFDLNFERLELNGTRLLPTIPSTPSNTFTNGLLTIDGTYSLMEYEVILQAVDYINTNQNPNSDMVRMIQFQAFSGSLGSNTASVSFNMFKKFNDPPLLYLEGSSEEQQNRTVTLSNDDISVRVVGGSFTLTDPDSSGITALCFEVETSDESVSSTSGAVHPDPNTQNLYCANSSTSGTTQLFLFQHFLENSNYHITTAPTSPQTRTVRVFAEDNGINEDTTDIKRSEIAFLFITFPGSGIAASGPSSTSETTMSTHLTAATSLSTTVLTLSASLSLTMLLSPSTTLSPLVAVQSTTMMTQAASLSPTTTETISAALSPTMLSPSTTSSLLVAVQSTTTMTLTPLSPAETISAALSPTTTMLLTPEFQSTPIMTPTPLSPTTVTTISATCPPEENVPLFSGATFALFLNNWTEANVGERQMRPCPQICQELANVPPQGNVIRICNSITETIAEWIDVDYNSCGLTESALQLCEANQLTLMSSEARGVQGIDAEVLSESVANITTNATKLGTSGVSSATTLLEDLTNAAIEQPEVRENYLQAIDNILDVEPEVILSSQIETNSSARLLQSLTQFTQNVPLSSLIDNQAINATINQTNRQVFALRNFGLVIQDVPVDNFTGSDFSVDLGPVKDAIRLNGSIDEDSLLSVIIPNATASLQVSTSIFDASDNGEISQMNSNKSTPSPLTPSLFSNKTRRLVFSVFLLNSLFISSNTNCTSFAIGSIIASVQFNTTAVAYNDSNPFNESIQVTLQEYREACDDTIPDSVMPMCARFEVTDADVKWTTDDCTFISSEDGTTRCDCSQPGHFGLIFDIKPGTSLQPLVLEYVSYIGATLSIICLLVMFFTHLFSSELRSKNSGQLIMHICIALIGFYLVFFIAGHVTMIKPLCGVVAALIQYFLLAYFTWTVVAAVVLYFRVVYWFKEQGPRFVLKVAVIAWVLPLAIVAVSAGVGYRNYVNDYFCRSTGKPFYFGTLLPFGLLYLFSWVIFIIIIAIRIRDHIKKDKTASYNNSTRDEKLKDIKKTIILALSLSFLFGLGWGFGLAATSSNVKGVTFAFQLLFSIFVGVQGILILLLHGARSPRVMKQWKMWCMKVCCCKRFKLRPKSPIGLVKHGFQSKSPRQVGNQFTLVIPLNGMNLPEGVSTQKVLQDDSLSSSGSNPEYYRNHAHTVSTIRPHRALCRVDTQCTTLGSEFLSTSGGDSLSDGSEPDKFLETI